MCAEKCLTVGVHQVTDKDLAPLPLLALVWSQAGHTGWERRFNVACCN